MADTKMVQITDQDGGSLYPKTKMAQVVNANDQTLEALILTKNNTVAYTPTSDYNPATKSYVDNKPKINIVTSIQKPKNMRIGDLWDQEPASPYTWAQVDGLGYKFSDVNNLDITWADADLGGW